MPPCCIAGSAGFNCSVGTDCAWLCIISKLRTALLQNFSDSSLALSVVIAESATAARATNCSSVCSHQGFGHVAASCVFLPHASPVLVDRRCVSHLEVAAAVVLFGLGLKGSSGCLKMPPRCAARAHAMVIDAEVLV